MWTTLKEKNLLYLSSPHFCPFAKWQQNLSDLSFHLKAYKKKKKKKKKKNNKKTKMIQNIFT